MFADSEEGNMQIFGSDQKGYLNPFSTAFGGLNQPGMIQKNYAQNQN